MSKYARLLDNEGSKAVPIPLVLHTVPQGDKQPSNQATKQPRLQQKPSASDESIDIEAIRKAVKQVGKETTSHRMHEDEKEALEDILYSLKKKGLKSNENEFVRIAINHLIADYQDNKDDSILVRVLESLKA